MMLFLYSKNENPQVFQLGPSPGAQQKGWLHKKGSPSLPRIPGGTVAPMTPDEQFAER